MKKPELVILGVDGGSPEYVKNAVKEGKLPGFARLMEKGVFFTDCMTVFPSISPTCWTAIETGAVPAVSGALCQAVHVPGTHPAEFITPYNSTNVRAERFWEAAARIGKKSLMVDVLSSGPAKSDLITQIMGGVSVTPDRDPADTYRSGVPQQIFRVDPRECAFSDAVKTRGGTWEMIGDSEAEYERISDNTYVFPVVYKNDKYDPDEVEAFSWTVTVEKNGIRIGADAEDAGRCPVVEPGKWSPVLTRRLMTNDGCVTPFRFRARLEEFDPALGTCSILVTSAMNFRKEITPESAVEDALEIDEIYSSTAMALWDRPCDVDKYFDCEEWALLWHRQMIERCMEKEDYDIVFDYSGHVDTVNHRFRGVLEKVEDHYEKDYETAVAAYEKAYRLVDEQICWLLEHVADENTTFALISDHGSVGARESMNQFDILEKEGLITYIDPEGDKSWRNINIDWSRTKAYSVGSCYINVNLKGREPEGIVEPEDYDKVVNQIIRALQKGVETTDDHRYGLAFAVDKEQAGFIGHGGENCGDVVYGIVGGKLGGYFGGVHAQQIPSARSATGDIRSTCIMCGPRFKENVSLDRPVDLTDFAPTLCYALGYPQPKDATGGVVFQALKEE